MKKIGLVIFAIFIFLSGCSQNVQQLSFKVENKSLKNVMLSIDLDGIKSVISFDKDDIKIREFKYKKYCLFSLDYEVPTCCFLDQKDDLITIKKSEPVIAYVNNLTSSEVTLSSIDFKLENRNKFLETAIFDDLLVPANEKEKTLGIYFYKLIKDPEYKLKLYAKEAHAEAVFRYDKEKNIFIIDIKSK